MPTCCTSCLPNKAFRCSLGATCPVFLVQTSTRPKDPNAITLTLNSVFTLIHNIFTSVMIFVFIQTWGSGDDSYSRLVSRISLKDVCESYSSSALDQSVHPEHFAFLMILVKANLIKRQRNHAKMPVWMSGGGWLQQCSHFQRQPC